VEAFALGYTSWKQKTEAHAVYRACITCSEAVDVDLRVDRLSFKATSCSCLLDSGFHFDRISIWKGVRGGGPFLS